MKSLKDQPNNINTSSNSNTIVSNNNINNSNNSNTNNNSNSNNTKSISPPTSPNQQPISKKSKKPFGALVGYFKGRKNSKAQIFSTDDANQQQQLTSDDYSYFYIASSNSGQKIIHEEKEENNSNNNSCNSLDNSININGDNLTTSSGSNNNNINSSNNSINNPVSITTTTTTTTTTASNPNNISGEFYLDDSQLNSNGRFNKGVVQTLPMAEVGQFPVSLMLGQARAEHPINCIDDLESDIQTSSIPNSKQLISSLTCSTNSSSSSVSISTPGIIFNNCSILSSPNVNTSNNSISLNNSNNNNTSNNNLINSSPSDSNNSSLNNSPRYLSSNNSPRSLNKLVFNNNLINNNQSNQNDNDNNNSTNLNTSGNGNNNSLSNSGNNNLSNANQNISIVINNDIINNTNNINNNNNNNNSNNNNNNNSNNNNNNNNSKYKNMEAYFSKRENLPIPFPALQSELGQMIENSSNKGYISSRNSNNEDKRKKQEQRKKAASAPEMKVTKDRFMETMNDPNSFRNFQSFMQNTLSTEYLNFFMEIDRYKNIDDDTKLKFTFDEIWRRFFDQDSNTQLYIESTLRRKVESQKSNPTHNSFNDVYEELLHDIICDSFKNYLTSPFNPDWRIEMNKKMKILNNNNIASTSNIASSGNKDGNKDTNNKDNKENNNSTNRDNNNNHHHSHHNQNRERFDNYNKEKREKEKEKEKEKERSFERDLDFNLSNHSNSSSGSGRDNIENIKSPTSFNNILQSPQTVSKVHEIYYKDSTNSLAISITLDNEEEPSIFHLDSNDMESLIEEVVKDNITVHTEINYNEVSIHKWIACGASGKVYNGQYKGKDVAIKVLGPEVCAHFDLNEFKREVALMSIFKHDNLVRCLGAGSYGENYFHITDYCHNGTLSNYLKDSKNTISSSLKLHFALGIAKGMRYLHSMSIIHRDLKTMNILLTKRLKIKIVDFGTSRVANKNMTSHVGTQAWMAPEIFTSKSYTQKVDVYSYAIVLLEIFTRKSAYDDTAVNIPFLVCKGERPDIPKDIPTPIANLIKKCWSQKPSHRPSFIKIAAYLESIIYPSISNSLGLVASTSFSSSALWSGKILATPNTK